MRQSGNLHPSIVYIRLSWLGIVDMNISINMIVAVKFLLFSFFCELEKSEFEFLEIKNQKALDSSFPHNFTCCFSAMYNFTNVLQLVQNLEMLQLLGVNRVVVYKTNCSADTQRVLEYYSGKGFVEVIPWSLAKYLKVSRKAKPEQDPGDLHYFGQLPALNDCLYRYMYQSKYVALHDLDELILPQSVNR
ncbi:hypothetical protein GOODEAATRI_030423 [Goodea atripinnis]|uniref:Glycosyltransferase family 92 protein n=1 Tax=Goodea atripinnis TaxID=208336 RepID=A0ABV0NF23_9TELE